jgi:hypothetical protein
MQVVLRMDSTFDAETATQLRQTLRRARDAVTEARNAVSFARDLARNGRDHPGPSLVQYQALDTAISAENAAVSIYRQYMNQASERAINRARSG